MIARIAEHSHVPPDLDATYVEGHRAWVAEQRGFCGGYHLLEADTGRALSVTLWEDDAALRDASRALGEKAAPTDQRISAQTQPVVRVVQVAAVF